MASGKTTATLAPATLIEARDRTDSLFELVPADSWYSRPVPERHRLLFYLGHLEAFDWNLIGGDLGLRSSHPEFDNLFAFGIDPKPSQLPDDQPSDWPSLEEVRKYVRLVRDRLDAALDQVTSVLLDVATEHRLMHAETFTYLLHDLEKPMPSQATALPSAKTPGEMMIEIPPGAATLGQAGRVNDAGQLEAEDFGWDNEFGAQTIEVPAFLVDKHKVTNGQYLSFVEAGAAPALLAAPAGWCMGLADLLGGDSTALGLARVRHPSGSAGLCSLDRQVSAVRGSVPPRGLWDAKR